MMYIRVAMEKKQETTKIINQRSLGSIYIIAIVGSIKTKALVAAKHPNG